MSHHDIAQSASRKARQQELLLICCGLTMVWSEITLPHTSVPFA